MNENRTGTWRTVFFVLIVAGLFVMTRPGGNASLLFPGQRQAATAA